MSEWMLVFGLVFIGFILVLLEILFVPGTTVVGILGFIATLGGIYLSFEYFGTTTGWWFTLGCTLFFILSLYYSFKMKTWERFSLKDSMKGKFNEGVTKTLKKDDEGMTISTLKPVGKAEFASKEYEVKSFGQYIEPNTKIKIVSISNNNILVEPIN
ncbi:MAG: NfeD family protein [Bacteroidota bacterium]